MRYFFMPISAKQRNAILLAALLLVSACEDQTGIQMDYVSNRGQCQDFAESNIGRFADETNGGDIRARNAKLVTLFSDCMFEMGWTVATPEREDDPENQDKQVAAKDDLRNLNDVRAGASAARAPDATQPQPQPPIAPQPAPVAPVPPVAPNSMVDDANRRAPVGQPADATQSSAPVAPVAQ